jgi:hypothetical protein
MEIEKKKVEINENDLGFCLIHVLYMVLPCGYIDLMGVYIIEIKYNGVDNMTILGGKQIFFFPNLFIYYDKIWQNQC